MSRYVLPAILLILSVTPAAPASQVAPPSPPITQTPSSTDPAAAIAILRTQWADNLHSKRLEESLALYAPDAAFLEPHGTRIQGQQALRALYQTAFAIVDATIQFTSITFESSGDLAFDSGSYTETTLIRANNTNVQIAGSYLTVYRRSHEGRWLILQQAWTLAPIPGR